MTAGLFPNVIHAGKEAIQIAKYYRDKGALQSAQSMKLPHCEQLDKLKSG